MITGSGKGGLAYIFTSVPQMPATSTFSRAASSGTSGIAKLRTSVLPGAVLTAARTSSAITVLTPVATAAALLVLWSAVLPHWTRHRRARTGRGAALPRGRRLTGRRPRRDRDRDRAGSGPAADPAGLHRVQELQDPGGRGLVGLLGHRYVPVLCAAAGTPGGSGPPRWRATSSCPGTISAGTSSRSRSSGSGPGTVSRSNSSRAMPAARVGSEPGRRSRRRSANSASVRMHRRPRADPRVRRRSLRRCSLRQRRHRGQAVLLDERQVRGEPRVLLDPVLRAARRRVQHHAQHPVRVRGTANAATVEQPTQPPIRCARSTPR